MGYAVTEGPFNKDVWQLNLFPSNPTNYARTPYKYLVRSLGNDSGNDYPISLPTVVDVQNTLSVDIYDSASWDMNVPNAQSFRNTLEGFVVGNSEHPQSMHNIVHDWVAGIFVYDGKIMQGTMEPLDASPNDPVFFLHHANVDRIWATWQIEHPGPTNYQPQGGQADSCINADDPGPGQFPQIPGVDMMGDGSSPADATEIQVDEMAMDHEESEPNLQGMQLDDVMYPYCLERYEGTLVWQRLSPRSQLDIEALGYEYQDYD